MSRNVKVARFFLSMTLLPLGACALVGIFALVADLNDTTVRILGTCASTALASMTGLGCAVPYDRAVWKRLAAVGMCVSLAMWASLLLLIWMDGPGDVLAKATALLVVGGIALSHICLLTVARLARRFLWARRATMTVVAMLAFAISGAILFENDDEFLIRGIGILSILSALGTIAVPILHRLSALDSPVLREVDTIDQVLIVCPSCGRRIKLFPKLDQECPHCALGVRIDLTAPHGEGPTRQKDEVDTPASS